MSSGYHIRGSHLRLIAASHIRNSLRSGAGVIFLVLSILIGMLLAALVTYPVEELMAAGRDEADVLTKISAIGAFIFDWFLDASPEQARHFLHNKPALISFFLILLVVFLPFLAGLAGFNQTSGDIGTKGLRYLLLRTERANIFLGRLIATYLFTLAVVTVIIAIVGLYILIKIDFYPTGKVLLWLLHGWFMCALFLMPWIAFTAWISAIISMPFLSLLVAELGLAFWVILVMIMKGRLSELSYATYLTPWGWKWWLFHPSIATILLGCLAMLAFTAICTFLGLRHFHRRDL